MRETLQQMREDAHTWSKQLQPQWTTMAMGNKSLQESKSVLTWVNQSSNYRAKMEWISKQWMNLTVRIKGAACFLARWTEQQSKLQQLTGGTSNFVHPLTLTLTAAAPDAKVFYFQEAMHALDRDKFVHVMVKKLMTSIWHKCGSLKNSTRLDEPRRSSRQSRASNAKGFPMVLISSTGSIVCPRRHANCWQTLLGYV